MLSLVCCSTSFTCRFIFRKCSLNFLCSDIILFSKSCLSSLIRFLNASSIFCFLLGSIGVVFSSAFVILFTSRIASSSAALRIFGSDSSGDAYVSLSSSSSSSSLVLLPVELVNCRLSLSKIFFLVVGPDAVLACLLFAFAVFAASLFAVFSAFAAFAASLLAFLPASSSALLAFLPASFFAFSSALFAFSSAFALSLIIWFSSFLRISSCSLSFAAISYILSIYIICKFIII